jgi:hypothetical protein
MRCSNNRNIEQTQHGDSPMRGTKQTRFFVLVRDGAHVPAHNFKISILAGVVDCHLEHAEMEVGDRAERPACDQNDGLLFWMALKEIEAVVRKRIVRWCGETPSRTGNVLLSLCGHEGRWETVECGTKMSRINVLNKEASGIGDPSQPDVPYQPHTNQRHRNRFPRSLLLMDSLWHAPRLRLLRLALLDSRTDPKKKKKYAKPPVTSGYLDTEGNGGRCAVGGCVHS